MLSVECFDWSSYVDDSDCMKLSLINNQWFSEEELVDLDNNEVKSKLVNRLNNFYDSSIHSNMDLKLRNEIGDKGSLCGLATIYQAAVQTVLTVSAIKQMGFDDVKRTIGAEMNIDPISTQKMKDKDLLELYHANTCVQYTTAVKENTEAAVANGRRKRETSGGTETSNTDRTWNIENSNFTKVKRQAEVQESEEEINLRSYGSRLRYECGLARMFLDPEYEETYTETWMQCNWNNSWTPVDTLDDCIWVACLYPPDPPEGAFLKSTWIGDPVEFYENVSYVCQEDDTYFEWDREMTEYNISCLPGGSWDEPEIWPICLPCKFLLYFKNFT